MHYRENTTAFVIGVIAGSLNMLFAFMLTLGGQITDTAVTTVIFAATSFACLVNLAGAGMCRTYRVAGGVMMLVTSLTLLFFFIITISSPAGEALRTFSPVVAAIFYIMVIAELTSLTAGILCFTSGKQSRYAPNHERCFDKPAKAYGESEFLRQYGQMSIKSPAERPSHGTPLVPIYHAAPKCVNCGADIPDGAAFCIMCGEKQ